MTTRISTTARGTTSPTTTSTSQKRVGYQQYQYHHSEQLRALPRTGCDHNGTESFRPSDHRLRGPSLQSPRQPLRAHWPTQLIRRGNHGPLSGGANDEDEERQPPHVRALRRLHHPHRNGDAVFTIGPATPRSRWSATPGRRAQRIRCGPVAALHDGQQFGRLHVDER